MLHRAILLSVLMLAGGMASATEAFKISSLPFTSKSIGSDQPNLNTYDTPPLSASELASLPERLKVGGGASDSGYLVLPPLGNVKVYIAYAFDEVTDDSVEQTDYLFTVTDGKYQYVRLYGKFKVISGYQQIKSFDKAGKSITLAIKPNGVIVKK